VISLMPPMMLPPELAGNLTPEQLKGVYNAVLNQRAFMQTLSANTGKPLILLKFINQPNAGMPGFPPMPEFKIPEYTSPRRAARVLSHLNKYARYLEAVKE
jgi:hypothetical protein